ncbi:MAG TPA: ABATE domain-containing protein, partial [Glaciihabitans sp.]|nr:ABATE domain-containing protein [Glaciihabitans sp.]
MHFAPDTEYSLQFAVVLANTVASASPSGIDELNTVEQLASLIHHFGFSGRLDDDEAELAGVRDIRSRIREMWLLERDEAVQVINTTLRQAQALPYLARHDQFDWHLHATDPEAPL